MSRETDPGGRPERIQAPGLARLPAFSHASAAGDLVFVAGTLALALGASVEIECVARRPPPPARRSGGSGP